MTLSILICGLADRIDKLFILLNILYAQRSDNTEEVEIRYSLDSGTMSTGTKRNKLLQYAKGEYVVFIDDDDLVSDTYVADILQALESKPDVVGFEGEIKTETGTHLLKISKDLSYMKTMDEFYNTLFLRFNTHLSPIKREIALQIGFPDKYVGEDYDYALRLHESGLITTEVYIPKQLYFYNYSKK